MTPSEFYRIWKQLTIQYPYDKCYPLNSFVLIDSVDKIETPNAGKLYTDFLNGHFWSRDWVNRGAKASELKVDFGLAAVERTAMQVQSFDGDDLESVNLCDKYYLLIAGKTACEDCDDAEECLKTLAGVEDWSFLTLTRMLVEFSRFNLYSTNEGNVWSTDDRLAAAGITPGAVLDSVDNFLVIDGDMRKWGKGYVGMRGAAQPIQLCNCRLDTLNFNIGPENSVPVSANTKCDDC